jgi:MGT family glycosyltransferase
MTSLLSPRKKLFIFSPPTSGHINPISCLVHEICHKSPNIDCTFYGNEENRELIEKTGAKFRLYSHRNFSLLLEDPKFINNQKEQDSTLLLQVFGKLIEFSNELLPQMMTDTKRDKPDMILYDQAFLPATYLLEILKSKANNDVPKSVTFIPNFAMNSAIMSELGNNSNKLSLSMVYELVKLFCAQLKFSWMFSIWVFNPIKFLMTANDRLNIVSVFPEIQPRRDEFDERFKFVGPCISEQARSFEMKGNEKLKALLEEFDETRVYAQNGLRLVYMSLGTMLNGKLYIYEAVLEAIRRFDAKPNRRIGGDRLRFIFSLGEKSFAALNEKQAMGKFKVTPNVLLCARVPQLEVLKQAHLFITHSGMNSTSEAIKYAVPMLCIPLEGDQPMVAKRMCDEMSLGVRLDPMKLDVDEIGDVIERLLVEEKIRENVYELSKVSAKYNGVVEASKLVLNYLNESELEDKKLK